MIRYYSKYRKADPVQKPHFEYSVICEFRFNNVPFSLISSFENENDPMDIRRKAMTVYSVTKKAVEFLIENGFFDMTDELEYSLQVYSRIGNDTIQLLGGGMDTDLENLSLEFTTMDTFGYVPKSEHIVKVKDKNGKDLTVLPVVKF